jgi:hypothetical protein
MAKAQPFSDRFHLQGVYTCPLCRHGQITAMPLMEAFSCNFCHHIFTTNFEQQILKIADSQLPLTWRWSGKNWKGVQQEGTELGWSYLFIGIIFVLLPTAIIAIGSYLFPPLPGSTLSWLPFWWTILTFLAHLFCLIWLIVEYYQFPIFLYLRALKRRYFARWRAN